MTRLVDDKGDLKPGWAWGLVILIWLLCTAVMVRANWGNITLGTFNDPDDAMRLVQVRDWMAGQSWFDVTQYRSGPPLGAPMHWSRLVDLPIAGLITMASWLLPMAGAERVALVAEPLLLFLLLWIILYRITWEVTGRRLTAIASLGFLCVSIGTLLQFYPTRIDHHGWQIMLGGLGILLMIQALKGRKYRAMLAGVTMALALVIAIEGLPLAVAIGAAFGVLYWRDGAVGRAGGMLLVYLATLTVCVGLLPLVMLGWPAAAVIWCDSLSPAYLWPMVTATVLLAALLRLIPQRSPFARLATLAIAGGAAAMVFRLSTPLCAAGPFATLDPLVYRLWYRNVLEGVPVWKQTADLRIMLLTPSLLGIVAALWAIRRDDAGRRDFWIAMLVVQGTTCLVSITVMRAMGIAHLLALPACAWLFLHLFLKARSLSTPVLRVTAGVLSILATPIGLEAILVTGLPKMPEAAAATADLRAPQCDLGPVGLRSLAAMPPTILFAPLDVSSHLLAFTPHTVIATGHHRAQRSMRTVISAFTAPPDQARGIMMATGATHVVFCAGDNEIGHYARRFPASIMAALLKGRIPHWLQPVPMLPGESIRVYRILPPVGAQPVQLGVNRNATPFMQ